MSPISSHARKSKSMSVLVCDADRQKRTRQVTRGVALDVSKHHTCGDSRVGDDDDGDGGLVGTDAVEHHA